MSNLRIEILEPELEEAYDQYLQSHHHSLFFYSSKYKNFLKDLLGCKEKYLIAMRESDICGILSLMYIEKNEGCVYNSLPYYGSNGGILADNPIIYNSLADAYNAIAYSNETLSSTIIGNPFMQQDFSNIRYKYIDYRIGQYTNISCQNNHWDELMARIDSNPRKDVKRAIREGVTVEIDFSQMELLRQTHQANMRAIGGIPKTDRFFSLVPQYFIPGQDFDLYIAKKGDVAIASLLVFYFNHTVEYYTPVIDNKYRSIQPLSLLIMTAMTNASRRGFVWWNWGGTSPSLTGVYRFKKKWATIECKYYYYTQLNYCSILDWSAEKILESFPNFFVVPFSVLNKERCHVQKKGGEK